MTKIIPKPCPMCGGKAKLLQNNQHRMGYGPISVKCPECGVNTKEVEVSAEYCANDVAAESWNRRTNETTPRVR